MKTASQELSVVIMSHIYDALTNAMNNCFLAISILSSTLHVEAAARVVGELLDEDHQLLLCPDIRSSLNFEVKFDITGCFNDLIFFQDILVRLWQYCQDLSFSNSSLVDGDGKSTLVKGLSSTEVDILRQFKISRSNLVNWQIGLKFRALPFFACAL